MSVDIEWLVGELFRDGYLAKEPYRFVCGICATGMQLDTETDDLLEHIIKKHKWFYDDYTTDLAIFGITKESYIKRLNVVLRVAIV